jgi:hypothetical protein
MIWFVQSLYRNYSLIFTTTTATGSCPRCTSVIVDSIQPFIFHGLYEVFILFHWLATFSY